MLDDSVIDRSRLVLRAARQAGQRIATAESCTGGLLSACLTAVPGSSDVFERGFVTYSNAAKENLLGVPAATLDAYGAVSAETALAMADGARRYSEADLAVAITGIAGPSGGSETKPVGLVHIGLARPDGATEQGRYIFDGDRTSVRRQTVEQAVAWLAEVLAAEAT